MNCKPAQSHFVAWVHQAIATPPAGVTPAMVEHLLSCRTCQRALHAHAAQCATPPLMLRALTERSCSTLGGEISACLALGPVAAAQRYPIGWAHIQLCPRCAAAYRAAADADALLADAPPARPPALARLGRHEASRPSRPARRRMRGASE